MSDQLSLYNQTQELPLAALLRPKQFDQYHGQESVISELEKIKKSLPHLIFWGPPGTGKTTLAHLIAHEFEFKLYNFNAVLSGVPELRKIIKTMKDDRQIQGVKPLLFIDEIHRFNKAQQDALLPYLEEKEFQFIGATTEYPQSALNRAILSRVRVLNLKSLDQKHIEQILLRGCQKLERDDLKEYITELAKWSEGDARYALNTLALLAQQPKSTLSNSDELKKLLQKQRAFDKNQDRHYDVISAYIKSMRGSDPDAALLWLAVMLDGGEDPIFIARRLMIFASEDIGLANSAALQVAVNAHYVCKEIGMPEARITLSHATTFMTLSLKSNSTYMGINQALDFVRSQATLEVPPHLKNHGEAKKDYKYPHSYPNHYIKQNYHPIGYENLSFYKAGELGSEAAINKACSLIFKSK